MPLGEQGREEGKTGREGREGAGLGFGGGRRKKRSSVLDIGYHLIIEFNRIPANEQSTI